MGLRFLSDYGADDEIETFLWVSRRAMYTCTYMYIYAWMNCSSQPVIQSMDSVHGWNMELRGRTKKRTRVMHVFYKCRKCFLVIISLEKQKKFEKIGHVSIDCNLEQHIYSFEKSLLECFLM